MPSPALGFPGRHHSDGDISRTGQLPGHSPPLPTCTYVAGAGRSGGGLRCFVLESPGSRGAVVGSRPVAAAAGRASPSLGCKPQYPRGGERGSPLQPAPSRLGGRCPSAGRQAGRPALNLIKPRPRKTMRLSKSHFALKRRRLASAVSPLLPRPGLGLHSRGAPAAKPPGLG